MRDVAPGVLHEPFDRPPRAVAGRTRRRFGVLPEGAQQRVRVGVARVERIVHVALEVEVAAERRRRAFLVAHVLEVEARLVGVIAARHRQRVVQREHVVRAGQRRAAVIGDVGRVGRDAREARLRDDVQRVDRRRELSRREADRAARPPLQLLVVERRSRFLAAPIADGQLVHHRRIDDARPVAEQALVREQIVQAEQAPVRRARRHGVALAVRPPRLAADVELILLVRPVVDANHVLALRDVEAFLEGVVVGAARHVAIERVRHREDVEDGEAVLVDAILGDSVAGERLAGLRVADDDQVAVAVAALREVARALQLRGHRHGPQRLRRQRVVILERVEEEHAVLHLRHRSAERAALRAEAIERLGDAVAVVEEVVRVQRLVPAIPVRRALVVARARLGDDVDDRAGVAAMLGAIVVELHAHFADRVEVGRAAEDLRAAEVVAQLAVDRHRVHRVAVAADVRGRRAEAAAERVRILLIRDAGQRAEDRDHVAAARAELFELVRRDQRRPLRALRLDEVALGGRDDRLRDAADGEREGADGEALAGGEHRVAPLEDAEAVRFHADRVDARLHRRENERAIVARGQLAGEAGVRFLENDHGAWQRLRRLIDDRAGDRAGDRLRGQDAGQDQTAIARHPSPTSRATRLRPNCAITPPREREVCAPDKQPRHACLRLTSARRPHRFRPRRRL